MPEVKKKRFFRLFKVAKELNVGSDTLVAYLQDKGHSVSNSPNTKLTGEQYDILLREYASEKQLKEKAEQFIERRKEESRTYKDKDEKPSSEKEEDPISPLQLRNKILPKRKRGNNENKESDSGAEDTNNLEPKEEQPTPTEETHSPESSSPIPGLKVVGKIDLDPQKKKTKPSTSDQENKESEKTVVEEQPKIKEDSDTPPSDAKPEKTTPNTSVDQPEPNVTSKASQDDPEQVEPSSDSPSTDKTKVSESDSTPQKTVAEKKQLDVPKVDEQQDPSKDVSSTPEKAPENQRTKQAEPAPAKRSVEQEAKKQPSTQSSPSSEQRDQRRKTKEHSSPSERDSSRSKQPNADSKSTRKRGDDRDHRNVRNQKRGDRDRRKEINDDRNTSQRERESIKAQAKVQPQEEPEEDNTENEVIRADDHTPKLSGLKVMGKIDLGGGKKGRGKSKQKSQKDKTQSSKGPAGKKSDSRPDKKEEAETKKKVTTAEDEQDDSKKKKRRRRKRKRKTVAETGAAKDSNDSSNQKKGGRSKKEKPSKKEVDESIRQTLSQMSQGPSRNRQRLRRAKRDAEAQKREKLQEQMEKESKVLEVTEFITANEFANLIDVPVNDIIKKSFELGMMVSINQRLDAELISIISEEYGYEANFIDVTEQDIEEAEIEEDAPEDLAPRIPIITVMGHVDHGKTTLLDSLRDTNVTAGEAGGITQHIGAYQVKLNSGNKVTFLDTPGHEAFTAMRARGAKVTDIVIVVIAADDAVMPQTREAINHAQAGEVPMVFAINKVDKPDADPDKIKNQLAEMNLLVEDWGGNYQSQEISALKGQGVDELLEKVILESDLLELKANPDRPSNGTVIEARLDKGLGNVATLLVQNGTLEVGDEMVVGVHYAKVRALIDQNGKRIKKAGPSVPVQVLGLSGQPQAGDKFIVFKEDGKAKEIAQRRTELYREQQLRQTKRITLEEIGRRKAIGNFEELNVIIRADVDGSVEALSGALLKLSTEEVQVNIILKAVGAITEGDVLLSSASDAIIIAFNVRPTAKARQLADKEEIDIRTYSVIYDAINDVTDALEGLLSPEIREEIMGTAEVREVFKISKVGAVAGCYATSGKIYRNEPVRIIREGVVIYDSNLSSLKRFKDDVKEVAAGFEFGAMVENYNDIKEGDILESYRKNEVKRRLKK